ncbi:hypothetical protein BU16DRAFT_145279 [Lophium mytilinum]|uniref:Uncharacterized protein n=1 Tax=Lophium mytilinum TaxID=390894 RepID=A0A6A6QIC8_9PEZI|nr:hypothetical protein BU16DRAFT_145279 [Lophium mytilinum]
MLTVVREKSYRPDYVPPSTEFTAAPRSKSNPYQRARVYNQEKFTAAPISQPYYDEDNKENGRPGLLERRVSRRVVPGLPRPLTFKRMNSEKRDRLLPVDTGSEERRATSMDMRGSEPKTLTPPAVSIPSRSMPEIQSPFQEAPGRPIGGGDDHKNPSKQRTGPDDGSSGTARKLMDFFRRGGKNAPDEFNS